MQFHSPSVVQAVPAVMAEPVPVVPVLVPVLAAVDEDATGVEATTTLEAADATGVDEATATEVADEATVAKTPPETEAEAEEATLAAEVAWEATTELAPDEPPVAEAQVPVGVARALDVAAPSCSTESPGLGKRRSVES